MELATGAGIAAAVFGVVRLWLWYLDRRDKRAHERARWEYSRKWGVPKAPPAGVASPREQTGAHSVPRSTWPSGSPSPFSSPASSEDAGPGRDSEPPPVVGV